MAEGDIASDVIVTERMVRAGIDAYIDYRNDDDDGLMVTKIYEAMFLQSLEDAAEHHQDAQPENQGDRRKR